MSDLIPIIAEAPAGGGTRAWRGSNGCGWRTRPTICRTSNDWRTIGESSGLRRSLRRFGPTGLSASFAWRSAWLRARGGYFHGTSACLSALYRAERYQEIVDLLGGDEIWPYKRWAVKALAAMG